MLAIPERCAAWHSKGGEDDDSSVDESPEDEQEHEENPLWTGIWDLLLATFRLRVGAEKKT